MVKFDWGLERLAFVSGRLGMKRMFVGIRGVMVLTIVRPIELILARTVFGLRKGVTLVVIVFTVLIGMVSIIRLVFVIVLVVSLRMSLIRLTLVVMVCALVDWVRFVTRRVSLFRCTVRVTDLVTSFRLTSVMWWNGMKVVGVGVVATVLWFVWWRIG